MTLAAVSAATRAPRAETSPSSTGNSAGLNSTSLLVDLKALYALRRRLPGRVFLPTDGGYDAARAGFSLTNLPSPDAVIVAHSSADVATAVAFARDTSMPIAVHGTGHNFAFAYQGGLLVSTAQLRGVSFDDDARTVRVEAGARWKDVLPGAQQRGLAPLAGSSPEVGVVGYTLHGGIGWLARKYGAAADSVRAAEIVTPDGRLLRLDAEHHADLLWAIRGGGGNFGAVTALELQLFPVDAVYGGNLVFPLERAREVLHAWRRWTDTIPEEMTSMAVLQRFPDLPAVPETFRGGKFVVLRAAFAGTESEGARLLEPLRALGGIEVDTFAMLPYAETGRISNDPVTPSRSWRRNMTLADLSDQAIETLVLLAGDAAPCPLAVVEIRHLGGALARSSESSFGRRHAPFVMHAIGSLAAPQGAEEVKRYAAMLAAAMSEFSDGGLLPGWLGDGDAGVERTKAGYSDADFERLLELKRKYDPANLFRLTHALAR